MALIYLACIGNKAYVGKTKSTLSSRIANHKRAMSKGSNTYFHNALGKYGCDEWHVLEEVPLDNVDEAEKFWIAYFKYIGVELYNMTPGGDGQSNMSQETREKLRLAGLGKKRSLESRLKQSQSLKQLNNKPNLGRKFSEEACTKLALSHTGLRHSEETRKKMSESAKKLWRLRQC